jgi:hypothetical protein
VKSREEIMNILEAFDLTGSFRDAGELAGCSHHTVAHWVAKRGHVAVLRVVGVVPAPGGDPHGGPPRRSSSMEPAPARRVVRRIPASRLRCGWYLGLVLIQRIRGAWPVDDPATGRRARCQRQER